MQLLCDAMGMQCPYAVLRASLRSLYWVNGVRSYTRKTVLALTEWYPCSPPQSHAEVIHDFDGRLPSLAGLAGRLQLPQLPEKSECVPNLVQVTFLQSVSHQKGLLAVRLLVSCTAFIASVFKSGL